MIRRNSPISANPKRPRKRPARRKPRSPVPARSGGNSGIDAMISKRALGLPGALFVFMALTNNALAASPLKGKSYMLEMASTQSGLTEFYVPPMGEALDAAGLTP